jgi:L-iditol 2-dehydrogenase
MGKEHLCENVHSMGVHVDGAVAEYALVLETNVFRMPDRMTFEQGAFCEPLACAVRGVEIAQLQLGDTALVLGAGGMGNLILQCAQYAGATTIIVSEPIELRRERALENGATVVVDPKTEDVASTLKSVRRIGADVVFECAGNLALQASAIPMARKGGTVVLFGVSRQDGTIEINPFQVNENELKITGSLNNPFSTARAVQLLASGGVKVENLITHRLPLEDYLDAFKIFGSPGSLRIMVSMDDI